MRYRIFSAIAVSVMLAISTTTPTFAKAKTNTTIVAPAKPDKKVPPVPQWLKNHTAKGNKCPQWEGLFKEFGLPVEFFTYFSWRESKCRKQAVNARWRNGKVVWTLNSNGTFDSGLLQINSSWQTVTAKVCNSKMGDLSVLLKPRCNVAVARYLYDNGGLHHWGF